MFRMHYRYASDNPYHKTPQNPQVPKGHSIDKFLDPRVCQLMVSGLIGYSKRSWYEMSVTYA